MAVLTLLMRPVLAPASVTSGAWGPLPVSAVLACTMLLGACGGGGSTDIHAPASIAAAEVVSVVVPPVAALPAVAGVAAVAVVPATVPADTDPALVAVFTPALAGAAAGLAGSPVLPGQLLLPVNTPVPTDAIFAANSFWYTPIPLNAPLHANSAGFAADFLRQKAAWYGTVNINTYSYASPVYIADATTPTTKVGYSNCQYKKYPEPGLEAQWTAVPIPDYALPANGTDSEMTIYQPSTNTLWEFWVARKAGGQWQACWGGRITNTNVSDGTWQFPYGATATGLPFIGGQVTAEELSRGEIRHAIGISLVEVETSAIFSWPARRSDGYNPQGVTNRIPEGLRFRLDPSINVDALSMSVAGKIIAKAAQKYGFVVWDKAGALSIRVQNPKSYTALGKPDPYVTLFAGLPSYAVLNNFPWDRLQFLPMDYGRP